MAQAKRMLSMFLAVVMVFTVVSVGISFTASAAAPYVTRTAAYPPAINTLTVPEFVTTFGTNYFERATTTTGANVKPEGQIRFYISGASNVSLSNNSSGVTTGTYRIEGNTYVWDITGGILSDFNATFVKFTITYVYNGLSYSSSASVCVKPAYNDAVTITRASFHGSSVSRDLRVGKLMYASPTFGSVAASANTVYYNIGNDAHEPYTGESKSGFRWVQDWGSSGSSQDKDMISEQGATSVPIGRYYFDLSKGTTVQASALRLYTREYDGDMDGNHPMDWSSTLITSQIEANDDGSAAGAVSKYTFTGTTAVGTIAENTTYTAIINGNLPVAGKMLMLRVKQHVKQQCKAAWVITQSLETDDYLDIYGYVYNKASLESLLNTLKVSNYQQSDFRTTNPGSSTAFRSWAQYSTAYDDAWRIYGKQDVLQTEITDAVNALQACIPVYNNGIWSSGMMYADSDYTSVDYYLGRVPSLFTANTYADGTKGCYYTYSTATALNNAIDDIAYDRVLDKRYQSVVNTMNSNLQTAITGLQYKSFNLVFNGNGATDAPATNAYALYSTIAAPTAVPTKEHFAFNGWYYDAACTQAADWPLTMSPAKSYFTGNLMEKDNAIRTGISLYAGWTRTSTQMSFVTNGDTSIEPVLLNIGSSYSGPSVTPTRTGYNFVGWCSDATLANLIDFSTYTVPATDTTLYGKWTVAQFDVTFNANSGTFASNGEATIVVRQNYNTQITAAPEAPSRAGFGFVGWYYDIAGTTPVDFSNFVVPAQNISVYAKWSTAVFNINYNTMGGNELQFETYGTGATVTALQTPTRAGYDFVAWYYNEACTNPVTFPFYMPAGSITVYAKWNALPFSIFFVLNDGDYPVTASFAEGFLAADYYNLLCGSVLVEPGEPTMEGYVFTGWTTATGTPYVFSTVPSQNTTLYATWAVEPDTVKFKLRTDAASNTLAQGDVITVTASIEANYIVGTHSFIMYYDDRYFVPVINGETISAGANGIAGVGAVAANGTKYFTLVDNPASAKPDTWNVWQCGTATGRLLNSHLAIPTYYPADWYTGTGAAATLKDDYANLDYVYFSVANNSTSASSGYCVMPKPEQDLCTFQLMVKDDAPLTSGVAAAQLLMPESFVRTDTVAAGKIYAALEDGNAYDSAFQATGMTYELINNDIRFNIIEMQSSTISFVTNSITTLPSLSEKVGRTITLPTPEKAYNNFLGWTTTPTGTNYVNQDEYVVGSSNVTLYAQWAAQSQNYKVRHWKQNIARDAYPEPCEEEETLSGTIGETVTAQPKEYEGFTCASSDSGIVAEDGGLVLNLYYTRNTITITLNASGGVLTSASTISGAYQAAVTAPSAPTRTGFNFNGWTFNNAAYSFTTFPSTNIEVVARWSAASYTISFYVNGVLRNDLSITAAYGTAITAPTPTLESNEVFSGWELENGTPYTLTTMPAYNLSLYGEIGIDGFYVTLYVGGEQYGEPIAVYSGDYLTEAQVAYTAPTGFVFSGWRLTANANGTRATFPLTPTSDMNLYGFTSRAKYTLTFWVIGYEDYYQQDANIPYQADITGYVPELAEMEGYRAAYWYTDESLTTQYDFSTMPAQNLDVYGAYILLEGTLSFDMNTGIGTAPDDIVEPVFTEVTTFPDGTGFEKEGYVFLGWALSSTATEDDIITSYTIEAEETVTLYAVWGEATVELAPRETSEATIDFENGYIYGLSVAATEEILNDDYLQVIGNGYLRYNSAVIGTGTTVDLISNYNPDEVVATYTIVIFGDLNGDGFVNALDKQILSAHSAGSSFIPGASAKFFAADLNGDGFINATDTTTLKSCLYGTKIINQSTGRAE